MLGHKKLNDYFPGLNQSKRETLVDRPGWLRAWLCDAWPEDEINRSVKFLVVYRSPLVTSDSSMYKKVADILLGADHVECFSSGTFDDPQMMLGAGQGSFFRLYSRGVKPLYTLEEIGRMLEGSR